MTDTVVESMTEYVKTLAVGTIEIALIVKFIKWFRKREKERSKYIKKPLYERTMYKRRFYRI